jgi:hypothetical protein
VERIGRPLDRAVHDIGMDLAPEVRLGAAADHADGVEALLRVRLDVAVQPVVVVGDALHDGPHQVGPGGGERQVVEAAPQVAVADGRALPRQPGREDDPAGTGRRAGSQPGEGVEAARIARVGIRAGIATEEAVVGGEDVVAQPLQAEPRRVVVVGEQVAAVESGDAGHSVQHVGLLAGHRQADPRRGAERHVGLALADGARADGRRVQVGHPGHHLHARRQPEVAGDVVAHRADDAAGRHERRQLVAVHTGPAHQVVVVGQHVEVAVVREPGRGHRGVGRGRHTREAHRQVVDRLEVPPGGRGDVGMVRGQRVHVADRVVAAGDARRLAHPRGQGPGAVAGDGTTDARTHEADAPVVLPHDAVADRHARRVDRHRAGPLAGDAHGHDILRRHRAVGDGLADGVADDRPPLARVLHGGATVEPAGRERDVVLPGHAAGDRHEPDLRAAGAQIDGEDETVPAPVARSPRIGHDGIRACLSSRPAMAPRMNSSASSVSPPATPP